MTVYKKMHVQNVIIKAVKTEAKVCWSVNPPKQSLETARFKETDFVISEGKQLMNTDY